MHVLIKDLRNQSKCSSRNYKYNLQGRGFGLCRFALEARSNGTIKTIRANLIGKNKTQHIAQICAKFAKNMAHAAKWRHSAYSKCMRTWGGGAVV